MLDSVTPRTVALQAPLSMGFSRQGYWSGCHALLQGIFLTQGSNPPLLRLLQWQGVFLALVPPGKPPLYTYIWLIHVDVLQTATQYCKAIVLQLKINKLKKLGLVGRELEQEGAAGGSELKGS